MSDFLIYTIDDDVDFNMVLKAALKPYNIQVKTHLTPGEFTKSVKEKLPNLCILDLNLQNDGEGFQLLRAMRNVIGDQLPIFIMSKRGSKDDVFKAMDSGATDFIPKPLDDKYLLLKLKEYVRDSKELDELDHDYIYVAESDKAATIDVDFKVINVGIDIMEVESDVFLAKESTMSFGGEIIKNIFGQTPLNFKVIENWQVDDRLFRAKIERELSAEQLFALRRWLINGADK